MPASASAYANHGIMEPGKSRRHILSIESVVRNIPDRLPSWQKMLDETRKKQSELLEQQGKPWPGEAKYQELVKRKADIDAQLAESEAEKAASQEPEEDRVAYRPSFEPVSPSLGDIEYLRKADGAIDKDPSGEVHLYLNEPATQLLTRVMRSAFPAEIIPRFDGTTLRHRRAERLAVLCHENSLAAVNRLRPAFGKLAQLLRKAISKDSHAVTVVNGDSRRAPERIRITEEEEAFHRAVIKATDGKELPDDKADAFLNSASYIQNASQELRRIQPHLKYSHDVAEELAAVVRSEEWATLGLSDAEAKETWRRFVQMIAADHGERSEILNRYAHVDHASQEPGTAELSAARKVPEQDVRGHREEDEGGEESPTRYRPDLDEHERLGDCQPSRNSVTLGALQDPVTQFLQKDIVPGAKSVSRTLRGALDDFQKIFAPQICGPAAQKGAGFTLRRSRRDNRFPLSYTTDIPGTDDSAGLYRAAVCG